MDKPTFGVTPETQEKLDETRKARPEAGAIWEYESKKTNSKYMNIVLNLPKSKLMDIINNSNSDENGNVKVGFVAFRNKYQNGISTRPAFRIYQDIRAKDVTEARAFSTGTQPPSKTEGTSE